MADSRLGVALFGAGSMGSTHFRNLMWNDRACVKWILEEDVPKGIDMVRKYDMEDRIRLGTTKDTESALKDPAVDVVVICTPPDSHPAIIKSALNAGKPVFCEKPLADNVADVEECYRLAEEKGLALLCGFNRRHDPQCRKIYEQIRSGSLGAVRTVRSTSRDPPAFAGPGYNLGSLFINSAVHDLDLVCWLVGEHPTSLYATGRMGEAPDFDRDGVRTTVVVLTFPGGAIGVVELAIDTQVSYDQRVEVLAEHGMMQTQNLRPNDCLKCTMDGSSQGPIYECYTQRYQASYAAELDFFLDTVQQKGTLREEAASTVAAHKLGFACIDSLKKGAPVTFSELPE